MADLGAWLDSNATTSAPQADDGGYTDSSGRYHLTITGTSTTPEAPAKDLGSWLDSVAGGASPESTPKKTGIVDRIAQAPQSEQNFIGAGEAAAHYATGGFGAFAGGAAALGTAAGDMIKRGEFIPSPQTTSEALRNAADVSSQLTYDPQTQAGQSIVEGIGSALSHRMPGQKTLADLYNPRPDLAQLGGAILPAVAPFLGPEAKIAAGERMSSLAENPSQYTRVEPASSGSGSGGSAGSVAGSAVPNAQPGAAGAPVGTQATASSPFLPGSVGSAQVAAVPKTASLPSNVRQGFFPAPKKMEVAEDALPEDQAARAGVLKAIDLHEGAGFRDGALSGNPKTQASEAMTADTNLPQGQVAQAQIATEQTALRNYGQKLKDMAGGTAVREGDMPEAVLQARGQNVVDAVQGIDNWADGKASDFYARARAAVGSKPFEAPGFGKYLENPAVENGFKGKGAGGAFSSVADMYKRFKTEGFTDPISGETHAPNSIGGAEYLRQFINSIKTPDNMGLVNAMKTKLDNEVVAAGGPGLFKDARDFYTWKSRVLDDPKGISSITQADVGGNRKVPVNQVSQNVATMKDLDQFKHITDTLKGVASKDPTAGYGEIPDAVAAKAGAALNELRQQFADNAITAGGKQAAWNPINYNKTVSANAYRMAQVFSPEEMAAFRTLNDAGYILDISHRYPGAAVQGINARQKLAGVAAGHIVGGAAGYLLGDSGASGAMSSLLGGKAAELTMNRAQQMQADAMLSRWRANTYKFDQRAP